MSQDTNYDVIREQVLADFRRKGGESTLAKYGPAHYRTLGKRSAAKRKAKKASPLDPSLQRWIEAINKGVHD